MLPLCILPSAMLDDQGEQLVRHSDATAASGGLHLDLNQAATMALRAPAGMAGAVRRAGRWAFPLVPLAVLRARLDLVIAGAASVRVGAAVLPGLPLQALHDLQGLARLVQGNQARLVLPVDEALLELLSGPVRVTDQFRHDALSRSMLIIVKRAPPANHISLHPTRGWLTTFLDAGVDLLAYDGVPCSEAAGPLAEAVRRLEASPGDYKLLTPAGREIRVIDVLRWAADKCARSPQATMKIRVRNA